MSPSPKKEECAECHLQFEPDNECRVFCPDCEERYAAAEIARTIPPKQPTITASQPIPQTMNAAPKLKECCECHAQFEPTHSCQWSCLKCEERQQAEEDRRKLEKNQATIREQIYDETPHRFKLTNVAHPQFNSAGWAKIQTWRPTPETPWLGLIGPAGTCKTRMAYLAAGEWLLRKTTAGRIPSFEFVTSIDISEQVMNQFNERGNDKGDARRFLDRLRRVELLLIDDLGKGRLTAAPAAELFALVNHRHAGDLLTIWTSNAQIEAIAACMSDDMAEPFARRLNESTTALILK